MIVANSSCRHNYSQSLTSAHRVFCLRSRRLSSHSAQRRPRRALPVTLNPRVLLSERALQVQEHIAEATAATFRTAYSADEPILPLSVSSNFTASDAAPRRVPTLRPIQSSCTALRACTSCPGAPRRGDHSDDCIVSSADASSTKRSREFCRTLPSKEQQRRARFTRNYNVEQQNSPAAQRAGSPLLVHQ